MRYLFVLLLSLAIYLNFLPVLQAADVVKVENCKVAAPILPILPIEPVIKTNKKPKFWQKWLKISPKTPKINEQVEPIPSVWYILMGIYVILSSLGFLVAGLSFAVFSIFIFTTAAGLLALLLLALLLTLFGLVAAIMYVIKLFSAAAGTEGGLKGWRFGLGYVVGILFTVFYLGITIFSYGIILAALGLVLPLAVLVFNIIDQIKYKKYKKSLENNPQ